MVRTIFSASILFGRINGDVVGEVSDTAGEVAVINRDGVMVTARAVFNYSRDVI